MDPRAGLDDVKKRKFLTLPGLELRPSVVQPVASRYTDWAIPASFSRRNDDDDDNNNGICIISNFAHSVRLY
jgi:hypothetical protein